jgi:hypothetical protein
MSTLSSTFGFLLLGDGALGGRHAGRSSWQGPLSLEEALKVGTQVCEGLEKGIAACCIATGSPATSCSPRAAPNCWTSGWLKRQSPQLERVVL